MTEYPFTPAGDFVALQKFDSISDSDLVESILAEGTKPDPCSKFSALLGANRRRKIQGDLSKRMVNAGLAPDVYLAIRWWCLGFIPVFPTGSCAVADYRSIDRPFSDSHSRAIPVAMDWRTACVQAWIGLFAVAIVLSVGFWVSYL
ncbi:MAG: hypothetical protein AAF989_03075 [Planctomycetota bacterium]